LSGPGRTEEARPLAERVAALERLHEVGLALSSERDREQLVERILLEAKRLCHADGGTLYLADRGEALAFAIMHNDTLGRTSPGAARAVDGLPRIPLRLPGGGENRHHIAACAANARRTIHVPDAYAATEFDFSGTRRFDAETGYRSRSCLAVPLLGASAGVIGVLQLINAQDPATGRVVAFDPLRQGVVEAMAAHAAVALDNQQLLAAQRRLLDGFMQAIAEAIDAKSSHTGGHCARVPVLTTMLAEAVCRTTDGPFAAFDLNASQWRELRVAAWLHDCGKIITPEHVMEKATKLEGIHDGIELVRTRAEALRAQLELEHVRAGGRPDDRGLARSLAELADDVRFLERVNQGGESMSNADRERIVRVGTRTVSLQGVEVALLDADTVARLSVARGTLTPEERLLVNGHMVHTIRMLERLPFPEDLARVPEYAGGHHERMDGTGYPRGIYAGDMSVPARMMAIADVFEALTARDRPYKTGKPLSETMAIMGRMKAENHLDPELFDEFVRSGVYRSYAERYLPRELLDAVDEAALLAIEPAPLELPPRQVRDARWSGFLPEYRHLQNR